MSLCPAPSTQRGSTARGHRSYMARPWEKSITSSSVPWMTSTGEVTLEILSMLGEGKERNSSAWGFQFHNIRESMLNYWHSTQLTLHVFKCLQSIGIVHNWYGTRLIPKKKLQKGACTAITTIPPVLTTTSLSGQHANKVWHPKNPHQNSDCIYHPKHCEASKIPWDILHAWTLLTWHIITSQFNSLGTN